jgi:hypothetical protein
MIYFLKKKNQNYILFSKFHIQTHHELRNRERWIKDLGVERVGDFGEKTNFSYSSS